MTPPPHGTDQFLKKVTGIIESNLENEQFGVSELARALGMSRSNLHRKIKSVSGKSVSQFIREARLNKALELLKDSDFTVSEVAYKVGFGSATYFTKCFHDYFGFPPGEAANGEPEKEERIAPIDQPISTAGPADAAAVRRNGVIPMPWIITAVVVIAAAAVLLIIAFNPFSVKPASISHVIAVLPFNNDSPNEEEDYFVNSMMEEIMTKLSSLDGLTLVSRTTSEAYRDSDKSLRQIGKELQADYILEGSVTVLNNNSRIRIQLIETATDAHVWAEPFERMISQENLFTVQEEVARAVARELRLVLNPEQQKGLERAPTENTEAYRAYLLASRLMERDNINQNSTTRSQIIRAKQLLEKAIKLDSSFIEAYTKLGNLYLYVLYSWENLGYSEKAYALLDSGLNYAEKALSFYDENHTGSRPLDLTYAAALNLKGRYYGLQGEGEESEHYFNEAHKYMHMTYLDYSNMAEGCRNWNNYLCSVTNYLQFLQLKPDDYLEPWWSVYSMYATYRGSGFPILAREQNKRLFELNPDTLGYIARLAYIEKYNGNYMEAIRHMDWLCHRDSTTAWYWVDLSRYYFFMGEKERAVQTILERIDQFDKDPSIIGRDYFYGYVYRLAGMAETGDSLLYHYIEIMSERCNYPLPYTRKGYNHYFVARAYSILGDREKTLEYLEYLLSVENVSLYLFTELEEWPTFEFVRDTPEFQQVLTHLKTEYNRTRNEIALLLKEHGIDPA